MTRRGWRGLSPPLRGRGGEGGRTLSGPSSFPSPLPSPARGRECGDDLSPPVAGGLRHRHAAEAEHSAGDHRAARKHVSATGRGCATSAAATGMSVGALYYHLDGHSLPGLAPPRLPRRREVDGERGGADALARTAKTRGAAVSRGGAAGAENSNLRSPGISAQGGPRARSAGAARADAHPARPFRAGGFFGAPRAPGGYGVEHEQALAVEGSAVFLSRTKTE